MIQTKLDQLLVLFTTLYCSKYVRVHASLGVLNYSIAAFLYYPLGVHYQTAVAVGHFTHFGLGFFADKYISFDSPETTLKVGGWKYFVVEVMSYSSIFISLAVCVEVIGLWPVAARIVVAMPIGTLVSYTLNKQWTFR
jgi:putative flippase GtrA